MAKLRSSKRRREGANGIRGRAGQSHQIHKVLRDAIIGHGRQGLPQQNFIKKDR